MLGTIFGYDWISIPLVYTQVVNLAVRSYFIVSLLARQYLDPKQKIPGSEVCLPLFYDTAQIIQISGL